ncbi:MAG TPA: CoA ester lyase [Alphaproteobacteria bacterium]|nr:CoA ester lyase [Alphaproteobacteria bacterium]
MSFTIVERAPLRLTRSLLFVPGVRPQLFEKAAQGPADALCLDIEDSVAPADKPQARANIIQALKTVDFGAKSLSVRINGLDTPWAYRDVVDIMEQAGERLDLIMIPKVGVAADVYAIDMLVSQIEMATGRKKKLKLEVIIESVLGLQNADAIAGASKRMDALHFGAADFAASAGMRTTNIGGPNPDYVVLTDKTASGQRDTHWSDMWHYATARMVAAARAAGIRPVDGPFGDYSDAEGYNAQARRSAVMGCEGKWAIHPSQVALANSIFTPPAEEVARAREILAAMAEGQAAGMGAVALHGRLIDLASIRQAEVIVRMDEMIKAGKA